MNGTYENVMEYSEKKLKYNFFYIFTFFSLLSFCFPSDMEL